MVAEMARLGQPWLSFFTPEQIDHRLRAQGFSTVEDLSWNDLRQRHFPPAADIHDPLGGHFVRARRC